MRALLTVAILTLSFSGSFSGVALANATIEIERGQYLVAIANCASCHAQAKGGPLIGAEIGYRVANLGIFYPPNLTPDLATGLGRWTQQDIVKSLHTGLRPDGRQLAPIMPWRAYAHLTQEDAQAIAVYLQSLPAVTHAVPPPATVETATYPYHDVIVPKPSRP